jgi:hypothetical protein
LLDASVFRLAGDGNQWPVSGRTLKPVERAIGWMVGVPFASWRYVSREIEIRHEESNCGWPIEAFPNDDCSYPGTPELLQRPSGGSGAAFRRLYRVRIERPLLSADELMSIVLADPNVACPLEIGRFEREESSRAIEAGDEMRVRLPGPWNGPVRVIEVGDRAFRLATLRGHMEAGEIEFRAHDEGDELVFEIESWARSSDRVFDFVYDRLGIARELQLDMWAYFLERVAQASGGAAVHGIEVFTQRCDDHPL